MRLAIVAINAYPAIVPQAGTTVGGLETFAWSLARTLAGTPTTQVQMIVRHTSQPRQRVVEGVEIWAEVEPLRPLRKAVSRNIEVLPAFPWLRIKRFHPGLLWQVPLLACLKLTGKRLPHSESLEQLLRSARPDAVLTLGVSETSAAAVAIARKMGIPSWLWIRSNADLDERFFIEGNYVDPYGVTSTFARESLQADGIVVQTQWQQHRVRERLQRDSVVIHNPVDSERFSVGDSAQESRGEVLWVGRFDRHHKRPHLALEVAKLCPNVAFLWVVNAGDPTVEREIRSHCPPNVRIDGYVPRDQMPDLQRSARIFLSTGSNAYEGFPNVLLEAAASGTPIVSLEDFDGFLSRSHAGFSSGGDLRLLAQKTRELWEMPAEWHACSQSGAEYVRREHTLEQCVQRLLNVTQIPNQHPSTSK